MPHPYHPDDYNAHGWLRLPFFFWLVLLLPARTWLLFIMAGASQGQGTTLLALFYPDRTHFWSGMALGLPAALVFLLSGRRHLWPRLWQAGWWLMLATLAASLMVQGVALWQAAQPAFSDLLLTLLDSAALAWWLLSRSLKRAFSAAENGG
ncbi:DUF2919 domain-containing protein [Chimaeribacter arupi]|uniref:DUF2919 domain-containing protein n=2 Tax=Yersiniaceae TaxID=1903411 RepID=A0A2N5EHR2_9GAMM|nr:MULTISPECIES: DUF2919 domain-containing protein [Yersiniaceae]MBS0971635.1 DUF2919 domain-containing protein [Nissabacter archeti]MDV5142676.1 DUF2919 domain-containing protein [Chimaeribacter arupi]PLR29252.1 DUF2919 domain-containing protein [Chimaeribacter arupi]PLR42985.1 DUF2919 domain-containing protein [Chimaeribacter arupi]PLR43720.1 DUF2919 domain-containing protein [Chimaeribacter arupi]